MPAGTQPRPQINLSSFSEPLPGQAIVSPFGLRQLPWEMKPRLHAGVDIIALEGALVRSVGFGTVTRAGAESGYGRYVMVEHLGGVSSVYAHLSQILVAEGATVGPGTTLGAVGNTGSSTGAHLHFEMRNARGRPMDPTFFIGRAFANMQDWPLADAARISPKVRIAVVSNIPASKRELMIAREEFMADEAAMRELQQYIGLIGPPPSPPPPVELPPAPTVDEATTQAVQAAEEAEAAARAAPPPTPEIVVPPPRRPANPPRLAMPD